MLLALDTATTTAALAVYDLTKQQLVAELTWEAQRRQTQDLLMTAQQLLAQLDLAPAQLTALAVTTGPGSFTGVRIGISTVKGIALGLPTRPHIIGLPTLSVTASPWFSLLERWQPTGAICAVIHAGRGRYNWVNFTAGQTLWRPAVADHHVGAAADLADALAQQPAAPILCVGEVDAALASAVQALPHVTVVDPISGWRRAGHLARLAALHLTAGADDQLTTLEPLYLRAP